LLGCLPLASAFADSLPPVPVRVGNHEGYSRVVFNLPSRTDYHVTQEGQHVVVQFAGDVMIGAANGVPRNVLTVTGGAGRAEIVVAPGIIVRDWRLGNVVVMISWTTGSRRPINRQRRDGFGFSRFTNFSAGPALRCAPSDAPL
jgi:hypothetical protein